MRISTASPEDCRRSLTRLANAVAAGTLEPRRANACGYLLGLVLQSLRIDEQESKLRQIEEMLRGIEDGRAQVTENL